jgi:hypothetical protein
VATLKGRYLFGGIATLMPPASGGQAPLLAVAGYHVFIWAASDTGSHRLGGEHGLEAIRSRPHNEPGVLEDLRRNAVLVAGEIPAPSPLGTPADGLLTQITVEYAI